MPLSVLQVLEEWFQARPLTYSVEEFLNEVRKWQSERFVNRNVWVRLQEHVELELLNSIEGALVRFQIAMSYYIALILLGNHTFEKILNND